MIAIERAESPTDFAAAAELIEVMGAWDAERSEAIGFAREEVIQTYYGETAASLGAKFAVPNGGLIVARSDASVAGCVAFLCNGEIGMIHKLFVSPDHRGKGVGRALVGAALGEIALHGAGKARLITAIFMREAQALYRSFGFVDCEPFEETSETLRDLTVFMERQRAFG